MDSARKAIACSVRLPHDMRNQRLNRATCILVTLGAMLSRAVSSRYVLLIQFKPAQLSGMKAGNRTTLVVVGRFDEDHCDGHKPRSALPGLKRPTTVSSFV